MRSPLWAGGGVGVGVRVGVGVGVGVGVALEHEAPLIVHDVGLAHVPLYVPSNPTVTDCPAAIVPLHSSLVTVWVLPADECLPPHTPVTVAGDRPNFSDQLLVADVPLLVILYSAT